MALGAQTGQRVVRRVIRRTGRPSVVVLLLGSIIGLAVLSMAAIGVSEVVQQARAGEPVGRLNLDVLMCRNMSAASA